jgi:outer membrane protein assembly factor BamE
MPGTMRTTPKTTLSARLLLACALLGIAGCIYRMPIQQGNFLEKKQVDQLEPGMTRSQVMFLLGTPMVPNGFDQDRWDYYYYAKYNKRIPADTLRLTVYFKDEKVDHVDKPLEPEKPPVTSEQKTEAVLEETVKPNPLPAEQPPLPPMPSTTPELPGVPAPAR